MADCEVTRLHFLDLLQGRAAADTAALVDAHLGRCNACSAEFRELEAAWQMLGASADPSPPAGLRQTVFAYAERAAAEGEGVASGVWEAVKKWRAVFAGSLGALGGYAVLTLISPIPDTVELCRVTLLRNAAMSMGELCLVYVAVAALYSGLPVGVAAYLWPGSQDRWGAGLAEAAVFALLAAPTFLMQSGSREWLITSTALAGLVLGSLGGGLFGSWVRVRRFAGA
ncbi:MAG: hypothetical protein HY702_07310 [Gemmatimonadetes bacterium]|nr:hypothetical protein [Gemmatimonadota bacterium]